MNCLPATALLIDADDTLWETNIYFEGIFVRSCSCRIAAPRPLRIL